MDVAYVLENPAKKSWYIAIPQISSVGYRNTSWEEAGAPRDWEVSGNSYMQKRIFTRTTPWEERNF